MRVVVRVVLVLLTVLGSLLLGLYIYIRWHARRMAEVDTLLLSLKKTNSQAAELVLEMQRAVEAGRFEEAAAFTPKIEALLAVANETAATAKRMLRSS